MANTDRLLSDEEIVDISDQCRNALDAKRAVAKAQRDLTAAAVNAEWVRDIEKHQITNPLPTHFGFDRKLTTDIPSNEIWFAFTKDQWQERKRSVGAPETKSTLVSMPKGYGRR